MSVPQTIDTNNLLTLKARVKSTPILSGRENTLASRLAYLVQNRKDCENGAGSDRRCFFLIGGTGTGKSFSLAHQFKDVPEFLPYENEYGEMIWPLISLEAPKDFSTKQLAMSVLEAMKLPSEGSEAQLYKTLKAQLPERGVKFLHIDEMQHAQRSNSARAIQNLQDTLKSLIQNKDWPLHTIYSGVPQLNDLLTGDKQLARRSIVMRFDQMECPDDFEWIEKCLRETAIVACGLKLDEHLLSQEFMEKLCNATFGAWGTMIELIQEVSFSAIERGSKTLVNRDFARQYALISGCLRKDNIFVSENWRNILPQHSLVDMR